MNPAEEFKGDVHVSVDGALCRIAGVGPMTAGRALQAVLPMVRQGQRVMFTPMEQSDVATTQMLTGLADSLTYSVRRPRGRPTAPQPIVRSPRSASASLLVAVGGDPDRAPSSPGAVARFAQAAERFDIRVETWEIDSGDVPAADGAFMRTYTEVDNAAYRLAVAVEQAGGPVIDSPEAIRRGCNKIFQALEFMRAGIPTPGTAVVFSVDQLADASERLGAWPIVVKHPTGAFCNGVYLARSPAELEEVAGVVLADAGGVVLQRFAPTLHDWRIGILGGKPLYAARYGMAAGSWRLCERDLGGENWGETYSARLEDAPPGVIETALAAAALMGDSLWGVDVKVLESGPAVIEVNDNPDIDDTETGADGSQVWRNLAAWFSAEFQSSRSAPIEAVA